MKEMNKPPRRIPLDEIVNYETSPMTIRKKEYLVVKNNKMQWVYSKKDNHFKRSYKL